MTRHGFLELTGNSCLELAPLRALAWTWPADPSRDALALTFAAGVVVTNLLHKWAHADEVPAAVLQRCRLVLAPAAHAVHHRPGYAGACCVTAGWTNALHPCQRPLSVRTPRARDRDAAVPPLAPRRRAGSRGQELCRAPAGDRPAAGHLHMPPGRWLRAYGIAGRAPPRYARHLLHPVARG